MFTKFFSSCLREQPQTMNNYNQRILDRFSAIKNNKDILFFAFSVLLIIFAEIWFLIKIYNYLWD